ncbi:hypothetical protein M0804_014090 [Polistes exclamans]|nr:hypothetical protein M0804_014090 [Polistes exclamans]
MLRKLQMQLQFYLKKNYLQFVFLLAKERAMATAHSPAHLKAYSTATKIITIHANAHATANAIATAHATAMAHANVTKHATAQATETANATITTIATVH